MTLQEQLRKLTTGGPGVTHIATETLFEDCAKELDHYADLDRAAREFLTAWGRDIGLWQTCKGDVRDALRKLNDLASKPSDNSGEGKAVTREELAELRIIVKQKDRIRELEDLVIRELPFARAEGRKTWVTDATRALYSTNSGDSK
jgi:hypothetical protein